MKKVISKSKGISLPIEIIVIIAISVFVLVLLFAIFTGPAFTFQERTEAQTAFPTGCNIWKGQTGGQCNTDPSTVQVSGYLYKSQTGTMKNVCDVIGYPSGARTTRGTCAAQCCGYTGT